MPLLDTQGGNVKMFRRDPSATPLFRRDPSVHICIQCLHREHVCLSGERLVRKAEGIAFVHRIIVAVAVEIVFARSDSLSSRT